jgi:hypothetical protein
MDNSSNVIPFVKKKEEEEKIEHTWIASTLNHGMLMCKKCWMTDREASVLGRYCHV